MKIAIKPFDHFVPGKGMIQAVAVDVSVASYELGGRIVGNYELLAADADPKKPARQVLANGRCDLTPEQAAAWGADDTHFARSIALNAGLLPDDRSGQAPGAQPASNGANPA